MNTEKVRVVETVTTIVTETVESLGEGLRVMANVTSHNGTVSSIDGIRVTDPESENGGDSGQTLWEGYASPNLGGNFYSQGREMEVMTAVMEFVEAVRI